MTPAEWRFAMETAAKAVAGDVYKERYRKWAFLGGNRSEESEIVRFADDAAYALRSLPMPPLPDDLEGAHLASSPESGEE